jgi:hypothetical protein
MSGQTDARSTKFVLLAGPAEMHPFAVAGIKSARTHVDRPDRTRRVTDQVVAGEFSMKFRLQDVADLAVVRGWRASREHVDCTLTYLTELGLPKAVYQIVQACPRDVENTDLSTQDDASEVTVTVTLTYDDCVQIV